MKPHTHASNSYSSTLVELPYSRKLWIYDAASRRFPSTAKSMHGRAGASALGAAQEQERRNHDQCDQGENPIDVVERKHSGLRLNSTVDHPETLLLTGDHLWQQT